MALVNLTQPSSIVVTLDEAKSQCRLVSSDSTHDTRLLEYINRATASIETLTGARLQSQSVRLDLDAFPTGYYSKIDLGVYPVNAITSIKYDDTDNAEQTLVENTDYWVNLGGMYPCVQAVSYWPETKYAKPASVRITMSVGYYDGSPVTAVAPDDLRHAILMRVKEFFDNSGESETQQTYETVNSVEHLIAMHRRLPV